MLNLIPNDLHYIIFDFYFAKCQKCNKIKEYYQIETNCKICNYKSVFDDDYFLNVPIKEYKILCKSCIKNFKKNNFIIEKSGR